MAKNKEVPSIDFFNFGEFFGHPDNNIDEEIENMSEMEALDVLSHAWVEIRILLCLVKIY